MLFNNTPNNSFSKLKKSLIITISLVLILTSFLSLITTSKQEKQPSETKQEQKTTFESRVIELNDETFPEFNRTNSKFYLYFYEDNCKKCDKFALKFDKSSFLAEGQFGVKFAKVNLDKSPKLREHYAIHKFPEVFWANYEEADFHEYPGRLAPKALLKFINSQLNYTSEELVNWEQLEQKRKKGKYVVFAGDVQKFQKAYERLVKVAKDEDIDVIMWTKSAEILAKFGVAAGNMDAVIINKKKKSGVEIIANLGISEATPLKEIERLMEIYERKPYAKLDEYSLLLSAERNPATPSLFLLYSAKNKTQAEYNSQISRDLQKLARKHRKEFQFMNASVASDAAQPLIRVFNITAEKVPALLLISDNKEYNDDVDKFAFTFDSDKQLNEQNVEQFLQDFKANRLQKVIFSDPLPHNATDENGVFNLVGNNYEDVLFKSTDKDIALLLYSDFSFVNTEISERFALVVKKLKSNGDLLFAKANPMFNEIRHLAYDKLPTLFVIKGKNQQERINNVIAYNAENYDTLGMIEFIKANVSKAIGTIEAMESEDKIFEEEKDSLLSPVPKEKEEELIDFEEYNVGLRRYVRYLMDEQDEVQEEEEDDEPVEQLRKKKGEKKKQKDDL